MEPPISHSDVTTTMRMIADIKDDVHKIVQILEEDDGEEEEEDLYA
jgi:hypothetical protein